MFELTPLARSRSHSPLPAPVTSSWAGGRRNTYTFIATAAAVGIFVNVLLMGFNASGGVQNVPVIKHWLPQSQEPEVKIIYEPCPIKNTTAPSTQPSASKDGDEWTLERIKQVAESTKGYYARDYSLHLGWNNVRYIIETALLHSKLLDRTLVLPTYVYARACEWPIDVCASYATMVNRNKELDTTEWAELPHDMQMGWKVPLEMMIDIPHLRKTHNVILMKDWLQIYGLDPSVEIGRNGPWWPTVYHNTNPPTTLHKIPNHEYDPSGIVRVDDKSKLSHVSTDTSSAMDRALWQAMGEKIALDWSAARSTLGVSSETSDEEVEKLLAKHGWATTYTFIGALGLEYVKTVTDHIRQAAPLKQIRGLKDMYGHIQAKVLYLEGEIHYPRKPGSMRFTSPEARDMFAATVLHSVQSPERFYKLAQKIHDRMVEKVGGRMWMSAHMRRGDFVRLGWAMEGSLERHMERIKNRLERGRDVLAEIHTSGKIKTFDAKGLIPDENQLKLSPPKPGDPFYLATDEKDPKAQKWLREQGAVLIDDLLTIQDRQEFGWSLIVTDVLGVLEQAILGRSYYFYAHAMSSVAGGAVNLRAARGADPRTSLLD
ncbi:hypothetical protein FRC02_010958 [Tulasnella sp. 418]|nr:hypothetical protein FRC02_010958 [Tulasnella sp. 418]